MLGEENSTVFDQQSIRVMMRKARGGEKERTDGFLAFAEARPRTVRVLLERRVVGRFVGERPDLVEA